MDILLVRPNSKLPIQGPSLGLGYLASSLIKNGINVDIMDCLVNDISIEKAVDFIRNENIKIIGISCCTDEVFWVRELTDKIKSGLKAKIILGGPHPSGVMEGIFTDIESIDFSIYSEGETALPMLVNAILENDLTSERLARIPNLIWRNKDKTIKNFSDLPENLDDIDFPAWDLINPRKYSQKTPHGFIYKAVPFAPMIATRGCPYSCNFCSTSKIHGKKLRMRSSNNIITEIKYLVQKYNVREILFEDDSFTFDSKFVREFCNKIIESNLGVLFSLPNGIHIDTLNEEMLQIMRKANFYSFSVGIESGSPKILQKMQKAINLNRVKDKICMAKRFGFYITGFFIIGYPDETPEDINQTIRYATQLKIDKAAFTKYIPLPGTVSYNNLIDNGEIKQWRPYDAFGLRDIPYSPKTISKDELREYIETAIRSFYFRPSIILGHLWRIKSFSQCVSLGSIIKRFLLQK